MANFFLSKEVVHVVPIALLFALTPGLFVGVWLGHILMNYAKETTTI